MNKNCTQGFTLLEIIVAVTIIAILAALALPRYSLVIERSRQREAVMNLGVIRGSQMRYALENNGAYANNFTVLDIEDPTNTSRYFNYSVSGATATDLARATRNAAQNSYGTYDISIAVNGTLSVTGGTNPPQP
jgi:prepilin-type N-terminal cleavage/methylation domain-containing protein